MSLSPGERARTLINDFRSMLPSGNSKSIPDRVSNTEDMLRMTREHDRPALPAQTEHIQKGYATKGWEEAIPPPHSSPCSFRAAERKRRNTRRYSALRVERCLAAPVA